MKVAMKALMRRKATKAPSRKKAMTPALTNAPAMGRGCSRDQKATMKALRKVQRCATAMKAARKAPMRAGRGKDQKATMKVSMKMSRRTTATKAVMKAPMRRKVVKAVSRNKIMKTTMKA